MLFFSTVKIFYSDHWKSDTYTVYFILLLECLRSSNKFFTFETSDEKSLLIRFATINFPLRSPVDALCIFRVEKFRMYTYVHKKIKPICTNASWACQIARNKYVEMYIANILYIFIFESFNRTAKVVSFSIPSLMALSRCGRQIKNSTLAEIFWGWRCKREDSLKDLMDRKASDIDIEKNMLSLRAVGKK